MYLVKFHFIEKKRIVYKIIPTYRYLGIDVIPKNVVYVTIEDVESNICFIIALKNRAEIQTCYEYGTKMESLVMNIGNKVKTIHFEKSIILVTSIHFLIRLLRLVKKNHNDSYEELGKKIKEYAGKNKISCYDVN